MSVLKVYSEVDPNSLEVFELFKDIEDKLTDINVQYECWRVARFTGSTIADAFSKLEN